MSTRVRDISMRSHAIVVGMQNDGGPILANRLHIRSLAAFVQLVLFNHAATKIRSAHLQSITMSFSIASLISPPSTPSLAAFSDISPNTTPFNHLPAYISLNRLLNRYQHSILLQPPTSTPSAVQIETQREIHDPLPYHRTKWLHNIDYCRTLLLQLEHAAQSIRNQSKKRGAIHDLAEKRVIIKKLGRRVEDIGREVERQEQERQQWSSGRVDDYDQGDDWGQGETLEAVLYKLHPDLASPSHQQATPQMNGLKEGKSVHFPDPATDQTPSSTTTSPANQYPPQPTSNPRDALFSSSSSLRQRKKTSPTSPSPSPEPADPDALLSHDRLHSNLTTSLVDLATQLKTQTRSFHSHLSTTDADLLSRTLNSLDTTTTQMATASQKMAFLRRMSEGQGWLGRMKLYAMLAGLWALMVLLVFAGPKLRF